MRGCVRLFVATILAGAVLTACTSTGTAPNPAAGGPRLSATYTSGITTGASLYGGVAGPDGRIWFGEFQGEAVAAITTGGTVTEYATGGTSQPCALAVGADGNVWAAGFGGIFDKITTGGTVTPYTLAGAHVCELTGPDGSGKLWFADYGNDEIGSITTAGAIQEYALPAGAEPVGIAYGSDGNLWVTDAVNEAVYKASTAGTVLATYSSGMAAGSYPNNIIAAPDGNLYFQEQLGSSTMPDRVARIATSGTITDLGAVAPTAEGGGQMAIGKDGNVYIAEYSSGTIGKVTIPGGVVSHSSPMGSVTDIDGLVAGPDGRLWVGGEQTVWALSY